MRAGYMAIGLAAVVGVAAASFAQNPPVLGHGKSAGTGIEAEEPELHQGLGSNRGISIVVPIGSASVDPESVDSEPVYIRRITVRDGMTIVEVSATPFVTVLPGVGELIGRPDQPASW